MSDSFSTGSRILMLGLAKSTLAAIKFLIKEESGRYQITASDSKTRDQYDSIEISALEQAGLKFIFAASDFSFINEADIVLTSPGIPQSSPVMQALRAAQQANPKLQLITDLDLFTNYVHDNYIAVTGTNGKTTTVSLIAHLLKTEALGNIGKPFMEFKDSPEPRVTEISSFQLFYSQLNCAPKIAVYLNFTPDHLDWHKDLEEYRLTKEKLFTNCPLMILNYDDLVTRALGERHRSRTRFFSTINTTVDGFLKDNILFLRKDNNVIPLANISDLKIVGEHNYSNALAAALVADAAGLSSVEITERLKTFNPVPHRMEYVASIMGKAFYNDSKATNPESSEKALKAFPKCIAIVGGKNKKLNMSLMLDLLKEKAVEVVTIGEIGDELAQGLKDRHYTNVTKAQDLEAAVQLALKSSHKLPVVFTPGTSSFDMFLNYEDRGDKFKAIVRKLAVS
jgi:UDP-N-acetylmuramoylalanine--D-glutamate ligase